MNPIRFLCCLLLLVTSLAVAEKYALLVGINDYPNDISPLRYCVADVVAFRDALINVAGFEKDNVYLMTSQMSGAKEPNVINVIKQLSILSQRLQPDDTFVFYFSGHGISKQDQSFLLATNSDTTTTDTLELSAIPLAKVSQILSRIKAQQLLTIIDACRNDPELGRGQEDNLLTDTFSRGFRLKRNDDGSGQLGVNATLYACSIGERAYEWAEKGHGVFSYYLLEGLKGKAASGQGEVTVVDLADYTQKKKWWSGLKPTGGKKQTPWLATQGGAKLLLVENKLGVLKAERSQLESELSQIRQQLDRAQKVNDVVVEADVRQREAKLAEKVRQAKAKEEMERIREENAQRRRDEAAQEQEIKAMEEVAEREQARRQQAEIARKRQQLEVERQKLEAEQAASLTVDRALAKARQIKGAIRDARRMVEKEIKIQVEAVPEPQSFQVESKGEFEKQSQYQVRLRTAKELRQQREKQHRDEVNSIQETFAPEVEIRTRGYQQALDTLNRDFELNESEFDLQLGNYDPEEEMFAQVKLVPKRSETLNEISWPLLVKPDKARKLKIAVENKAVKIQARVHLDPYQERVEIKNVLIEDLMQAERFGYPTNPGFRRSVLLRSAAFPGLGQSYAKKYNQSRMFFLISLTAVAGTFYRYDKLVKASNLYHDLAVDYQSAITETEFQQINARLNLTKEKWGIKRRQYYLALTVTGSIWALNMINAARTKPQSTTKFSSSRSQRERLWVTSFLVVPQVFRLKLQRSF